MPEGFAITLPGASVAGLLAQVPRKETLPSFRQWLYSPSSPLQRRVRAGLSPDFPILPKRAPRKEQGISQVFFNYTIFHGPCKTVHRVSAFKSPGVPYSPPTIIWTTCSLVTSDGEHSPTICPFLRTTIRSTISKTSSRL